MSLLEHLVPGWQPERAATIALIHVLALRASLSMASALVDLVGQTGSLQFEPDRVESVEYRQPSYWMQRDEGRAMRVHGKFDLRFGIELLMRVRQVPTEYVELPQNECSNVFNLPDGYWLCGVCDCPTPQPRLVQFRDDLAKLLAASRACSTYAVAESAPRPRDMKEPT